MNKQEAIEKIDGILSLPRSIGGYPYDYEDGLRYAKDIINQIDEQKKPVIPQFVADWIEECKNQRQCLRGSISKSAPFAVASWLMHFGERYNYKNQDIFTRAWLDGYEVEEEKRYQVKFIQTRQHLAKNVFLPGEYFVIQANAISSTDSFTRKELEEADFGWVFDCEGVEVREVREVE